jgi:hypothetical protein
MIAYCFTLTAIRGELGVNIYSSMFNMCHVYLTAIVSVTWGRKHVKDILYSKLKSMYSLEMALIQTVVMKFSAAIVA